MHTMESFDYILFNTGYAGRIAENKTKLDKLKRVLKKNKSELIFIKDEILGLTTYQPESIVNEMIEILKSKNIHINGIVIRSNSLLNLFRIHRQLVVLDYCEYLNNILGARIIHDKHSIVIIEYDTES